MNIKTFISKKINRLYTRRQIKAKSVTFRRHLDGGEKVLLAEHLSDVFSTTITSNQVAEIAVLFRNIEQKMIGRIAGDVDDHILNYFMIYYSTKIKTLTQDNLAHGEIGVLFGGSLLMMLFALRSAKSLHYSIAIDPLEGYYGQRLDPITNLPVNLKTVKTNINRFEFNMDRVRIVKEQSESPDAIIFAKNYALLSLWIDGDHSYDGVKRDWENYSPLVVPGGYVLLDNYHDKVFPYPGLDRFVDEELLPHLSGWNVVTHFGRSILFSKL